MRKYKVGLSFLLSALLFCSQGCYTLNQMGSVKGSHIELTNAEEASVVGNFSAKKKVNHFVWGLVSPADAQVEQLIANEVQAKGGSKAVNVEWKYQQTFVDGLLGFITLGIYSPFTLTVEGDVVE